MAGEVEVLDVLGTEEDMLGTEEDFGTLADEDPDAFLDVTEPLFLDDPKYASMILGELLATDLADELEPEDIALGEVESELEEDYLADLLGGLMDDSVLLGDLLEDEELGSILSNEGPEVASLWRACHVRGGRRGRSVARRVTRKYPRRVRRAISRSFYKRRDRVRSVIRRANRRTRHRVARAATRRAARRRLTWSKVTSWFKGKPSTTRRWFGRRSVVIRNWYRGRIRRWPRGYDRAYRRAVRRAPQVVKKPPIPYRRIKIRGVTYICRRA